MRIGRSAEPHARVYAIATPLGLDAAGVETVELAAQAREQREHAVALEDARVPRAGRLQQFHRDREPACRRRAAGGTAAARPSS